MSYCYIARDQTSIRDLPGSYLLTADVKAALAYYEYETFILLVDWEVLSDTCVVLRPSTWDGCFQVGSEAQTTKEKRFINLHLKG